MCNSIYDIQKQAKLNEGLENMCSGNKTAKKKQKGKLTNVEIRACLSLEGEIWLGSATGSSTLLLKAQNLELRPLPPTGVRLGWGNNVVFLDLGGGSMGVSFIIIY